jgi:hypothetical protein
MQVKALKTFSGRMGLIRTGEVITVEDRYGNQLIRNKLVEPHTPVLSKPESNKNLGDAPERKDDEGNPEDNQGNDEGSAASSQSQNADDGKEANSSDEQQGGGKGKPVSSPRRARRSRKTT